MAAQTAVHTSILQKILAYLELGSRVAEVIPEPHVQAISLLIDTLSTDLSSKLFGSPNQALQAAATKAQVMATRAQEVKRAQTPAVGRLQAPGGAVGGGQTVKSTF